jgi:hypothetical protein
MVVDGGTNQEGKFTYKIFIIFRVFFLHVAIIFLSSFLLSKIDKLKIYEEDEEQTGSGR